MCLACPTWTSVGNSCYWNTTFVGTFDKGEKFCSSYASHLPIFQKSIDWFYFKTWYSIRLLRTVALSCTILLADCRGSKFDTFVWLGIVTNGSTDTSTLRYTDNSPFTSFSNFWWPRTNNPPPDGIGFNNNPASVAFYIPSIQYAEDCESTRNMSIVCYKPRVIFHTFLVSCYMMFIL